MKRVRINAGAVGLVFKKGDYKDVLAQGVHWIGFSSEVFLYNLNKPFNAPIATEILLKDQNLANMLHTVEVNDNELVLVLVNGNLKEVLPPGDYFYWKGLLNYSFITVDRSQIHISEQVSASWYNRPELSPYIRLFEVEAYEKAVLFIDDVYEKTLESGTYRFWKNDIKIKVGKADIRQIQLEISGQELLTKDKAALRINFYAQYKVVDIEKALLENKEYEKQLYIAMQLALRTYVGHYTLDELLETKESVAEAVLDSVQKEATKLGVSVMSCGIRDIILTGEMKDIMNQVLIAQKKAQANIITRREETASTRSLLNTAKLMEENDMLFKLKEMEYVEKIAEKIGEISLSANGNLVSQLSGILGGTKQ